MKCLVRLMVAYAASVLFVHGQSAPQISKTAVSKPDFTISNPGAIRSASIACNSDGQLLAVSREDSVEIYELHGGNPFSVKLARTLTSDSPIRAMTFRDSNILISLAADRSVKTWDTASGRVLRSISLDFGNIDVFTFAPNEQPFLGTAFTDRVMLWNYQSGELLSSLETTDSRVSALAFTPDGKLLVIGTRKGVIRVLDVTTRKVTRTIDLDSPIRALSASAKYIMLGYPDGTLAQLGFGGRASTQEVSGHSDAVTAIAFSPKGERFASGSADGAIEIWDAESMKLLASLKGTATAISSLAFSADSKILVSSTANRTINGWTLPSNP